MYIASEKERKRERERERERERILLVISSDLMKQKERCIINNIQYAFQNFYKLFKKEKEKDQINVDIFIDKRYDNSRQKQ
jgi:hypothetical protein